MKRMIDTGTWDDPWFADLDPDAKLVFIYLLTNRRSTAAGAFEITLRAMAFETGIDQPRIESALVELSSRVAWWPEHRVVWVRNFLKHQAANENFWKSARSSVAELPLEVQLEICQKYPSLAPDDPSFQEQMDTSTNGSESTTGSDTHEEPIGTGSDTRSVVIEESSSRGSRDTPKPPKPKPAKSKPPENTAPNGTAGGEHPFALFESMCEQVGINAAEVPKRDKGKNLAVAKRMAESGTSSKDVASITRWLKSQEWRSGGVDMFTVEKEQMRWISEGKPDGAKPSPSTAEPQSYSTDPDEAERQMHRDLEALKNQSNQSNQSGNGVITMLRREA